LTSGECVHELPGRAARVAVAPIGETDRLAGQVLPPLALGPREPLDQGQAYELAARLALTAGR